MKTSIYSTPFLVGLAYSAALPESFARADNSLLVASLGSSYSSGVGLYRSYGNVLGDLLAADAGLATPYRNYFNYSRAGSDVTEVPSKAVQLGGKAYAAVVMTAGGNDLQYVGCLSNPEKNCDPSETKATFVKDYSAALDAIKKYSTASTPIYVVTYTRAIGDKTSCVKGQAPCNLSPDEADKAKQIYQNLVDWTVAAFKDWKSKNTDRTIKMITMRYYSSNKHDLGSSDPWINGSNKPKAGDGEKWHPNKEGTEFIGQAIYNDLKGLPVPPY